MRYLRAAWHVSPGAVVARWLTRRSEDRAYKQAQRRAAPWVALSDWYVATLDTPVPGLFSGTVRCFAPCARSLAGQPCACVPERQHVCLDGEQCECVPWALQLDALHAKDVNDQEEAR